MISINVQDPRRIDPKLQKKYDVRGPRYTSYPPATHFDDVKDEDVFRRWNIRKHLVEDPGLSLYLHIPFCRSRCLFCGCHSFIGKRDQVEVYVEHLIREMNLASKIVGKERTVRQVVLGGGTPNFLSTTLIQRLLSAIEAIWKVTDKAERSVEIDPRTSTREKLDAFLDHGFNRFSLGVQDLSSRVLKPIRKGQEYMKVEEVVDFLRVRDCNNINFDLIYGLPNQSLDSAKKTADRIVQLGPSRIALYSYAHVPWIHPHQKVLESIGLPNPELKTAIFHYLLDRFQQAGYESIGMDHFALPHDPLTQAARRGTLRRNFMGYTIGRGLDILGLGVSAISSIGSAYSQNRKELAPYLADVVSGRLPIARGFLLSSDDEIRRELILELFCNFRVNLSDLSCKYRIDALSYFTSDFEQLISLAEDGLVSWTQNELRVSNVGKFFIRNICMIFDRYLEPDNDRRIYSRTV